MILLLRRNQRTISQENLLKLVERLGKKDFYYQLIAVYFCV